MPESRQSLQQPQWRYRMSELSWLLSLFIEAASASRSSIALTCIKFRRLKINRSELKFPAPVRLSLSKLSALENGFRTDIALVLDWLSRRAPSRRQPVGMEASFCVGVWEEASARHGRLASPAPIMPRNSQARHSPTWQRSTTSRSAWPPNPPSGTPASSRSTKASVRLLSVKPNKPAQRCRRRASASAAISGGRLLSNRI